MWNRTPDWVVGGLQEGSQRSWGPTGARFLELNRNAQALLSVLRKFEKILNELTWTTGDYCDVWLTHDSASGVFSALLLFVLSNPSCAVRKAHNSGRNHLMNVRDYYACQPSDFITSVPWF